MSKTAPKFVVGNWKMNGLDGGLDEAVALAEAVRKEPDTVLVVLCPPATMIAAVKKKLKSGRIEVGAQNCAPQASGAFTGDISAEMLAAAGAQLVILGHSERRGGHGETNADVAAKVKAALRADLVPIVCVGETLAQRDAGKALAVIVAQLKASLPAELKGEDFLVAYEPVWAIGTGRTPTIQQIEEVHAEIRRTLIGRFGRAVPILYGGSVKPDNAKAILHAADVDGALVGGASLKCADFLPIVKAAR